MWIVIQCQGNFTTGVFEWSETSKVVVQCSVRRKSVSKANFG